MVERGDLDTKMVRVALSAVRAGFDVGHISTTVDTQAIDAVLSHMIYIGALMDEVMNPESTDDEKMLPPEEELVRQRGRHRDDVERLGSRLRLARVAMASLDLLLTAYYNHDQMPEAQRKRLMGAAAEASSAALDAFEAADAALPTAPEHW